MSEPMPGQGGAWADIPGQKLKPRRYYRQKLAESEAAHDQTRRGAARLREAISDVADCNCSGSKEENVHEECCPCFKAEKALTATASIGSWHEARLKGAEARGVEWAICNRLGDKPQQKALALRAEAAALDKGNQTKGEG